MITGPEASPPALAVHRASRRIGDRAVLRDVTLALAAGEILVLAGPNGAGKSSLLRAVGGRLRLDAGRITIDGDEAAVARRRGRLGVVPQDIGLDPHLTVADNLRLWARLGGTPPAAIAERLAASLAWAGLQGREHATLETLSGGMRRRVNLVAGLLHRPALLLLDEPTAGVDHDARHQFYRLIRELRGQGVGVVLVTHEIDEAAEVADTVVVMDGGAVVASGSPGVLAATHGGAEGDIIVTLADDGGPEVDAVLARRGFLLSSGRDRWRAASGTDRDLRALAHELAADGVVVRDVRWSRPSLARAVAGVIARHRGAAP
jgi:ABC-2 type transport system ATP-binding protein